MSKTLSEYVTQVRDLINDDFGNFYSTPKIQSWVNEGRREVAKLGQCVRYLPPSTGSVSAISVSQGGSGYTMATVTVSGPDGILPNGITATASAQITGGAITGITVEGAGTGYVVAPTITITGDGDGAEATATLTPHVVTTIGQETYDQADIDAILQPLVPGVDYIIGIQSCSISWGAVKPTLDRCSFSELQAYCRAYGVQYYSYPKIWAQYRTGQNGQFYIFPAAAQVGQMDLDCYCSVQDLSSVQTIDLIPAPWDDAVQYYAAYKAYMKAQRAADAKMMMGLFAGKLTEARAAADVGAIPTMYPGDY